MTLRLPHWHVEHRPLPYRSGGHSIHAATAARNRDHRCGTPPIPLPLDWWQRWALPRAGPEWPLHWRAAKLHQRLGLRRSWGWATAPWPRRRRGAGPQEGAAVGMASAKDSATPRFGAWSPSDRNRFLQAQPMSASTTGRANANSDPPPSRGRAQIRPPIASTKWRQTNRPIPAPPGTPRAEAAR